MNKKIFLPLLAVAALGASCTNEIDEFAQQTANGKGYKVNLKVANDVANTRITWDGETAVAWENFDQFSVYNIYPTVDYTDRFKASSNAAYKTVDGGQNFTSENVLFTGAHVLVYPLNKKFITPNADILVATGIDGDKGLGANSIFLSKQLLNISEAGVTADGITYNDAGYQKNIRVSVRPANAGLFLNLKEAGNFNLAEGDDPVQIKSVEVIHEGGSVSPFASSAVLARNAEYNVITRANGLTNTISTEYDANKPVLTTEGVTSTIAILPNEAYTDVDASTSKIIVYTNYGYVTINKAGMVTSEKDGKVMAQLGTGRAEKTKDNEGLNLSFNDEFTTLATRAVAGTTMPNIKRDVEVDMTTANIDGLEIYNSTDLKNAYRAFDLMGKETGMVTFKLIPSTDGKFELTKDAIKIINDHKDADKYATLNIAGISEFTLSGFGTAEYTEVPVIDQITAANVVLSADSKWKIDVANAAGANEFTNVINKGELQLTQGTGSTALTANIYNNNKLTFGEGETTVPKYTEHAGSMEIAAGQTVKFVSALFANGSKTTVKGELISTGDVKNVWGSTIDVEGKLLNITGRTLENAGTINILKETAQVILSANVIATDKGTVYVTAKDNNLNTGSAAGYVKLPVNSEEFVMSTENMGIANYIEFSGSKLKMDIQWWNAYVELKSNVKVTAEAAKVGLFVVKKDVEVTIADGSVIETQDINNEGKIYNYGTFKYPAADPEKGTIYDF